MLLPEMSPPLAQVWILGVLPERSQDNQASGGLVSGEGEGHREHAGSGILRKQSWIRGLDTPAPGENLIPNRQATGGLIPPSPTLSLASLLPACPPSGLHHPQWGVSHPWNLTGDFSPPHHIFPGSFYSQRGSLSVDSWDLSWG